jgi:hypothetical protein
MFVKNLIKLQNSDEKKLFWFFLIYFFILWFANFSNKLIIVSFVPFLTVLYLLLKNFKLASFFTYLASSVIFTGKNYPQQIVPPGVLPVEIYPLGFFINFTVTPSLILLGLLFFILIREIFSGSIKTFNFGWIDLLWLLFFFWPVFSDLIASKDPDFSMLFSLTEASLVILYFYIKLILAKYTKFKVLLIYSISALIMFQSMVSFNQFAIKSPVFKNLEAMVNIEYFGSAGDEILFAFRPLGTFGHANALGAWIASYLILISVLFIIKPGNFYAIIFGAGFATLAATLSRSSWLGFFVGISLVLYQMEKVNKLKIPKLTYKYIHSFVLLAVALSIFFIIPRLEKSTSTFSEGGAYFREVQLRRAKDSIVANPFFGVGTARSVQEGLSNLRPDDRDTSIVQNIHNWYVLGVIEHGIPYVLIFLIAMAYYAKTYLNKFIRLGISLKNNNDIIHLSLAGGIAASLVIGIFQPFVNIQEILLATALISEASKINVE